MVFHLLVTHTLWFRATLAIVSTRFTYSRVRSLSFSVAVIILLITVRAGTELVSIGLVWSSAVEKFVGDREEMFILDCFRVFLSPRSWVAR